GGKPVFGSVAILAEFEGKPVTRIADNAFAGSAQLTAVAVPDSVTLVGAGAFSGCSALTSVTIPDSVTNIRAAAFSGCSALKEMTLPFVGASRTATNADAMLGYIFGAESYEGGVATSQRLSSSATVTYYIPHSLKSVAVTSATAIRSGAFSYCTNITDVTVGNSATIIDGGSFRGCSGLVNMTLPFIGNSLTRTDSLQFFGVIFEGTLPTNAKIPETLRTVEFTNAAKAAVGDYAFQGCSLLTSVKLPEGITSIGTGAFSGCSGLTSFTLPDSLTQINSSGFSGCSKLTEIEFGPELSSLGNYAFSGCKGLTKIEIPAGITSIGEYTFRNCDGLQRFDVDEENSKFVGKDGILYAVSGFNPEVFDGIRYVIHTVPPSLTGDIAILNGTRTIDSLTFDGRALITSIAVPDHVLHVGDWAFEDCVGLKSITIGRHASAGRSLFQGCDALESITVHPENSLIRSEGNCIINREYNRVVAGCKTSVIPEGVTTIGELAFYDVAITKVVIPASVISLSNRAFHYCKELTEVTFAEGSGLRFIDTSAFNGCAFSQIVLPDTVESIGATAFAWCENLVSISIGSNVTYLSNIAFGGTPKLSDVYFGGSEAEWGALTKNGTSILPAVTIHFLG
ncbi:MAG: leucine-rich repeat domain-containing protein, partial [Firmicutes bacterium]|nr:leucine-rich repeat domain-containing protein [Bacillota bacterium]